MQPPTKHPMLLMDRDVFRITLRQLRIDSGLTSGEPSLKFDEMVFRFIGMVTSVHEGLQLREYLNTKASTLTEMLEVMSHDLSDLRNAKPLSVEQIKGTIFSATNTIRKVDAKMQRRHPKNSQIWVIYVDPKDRAVVSGYSWTSTKRRLGIPNGTRRNLLSTTDFTPETFLKIQSIATEYPWQVVAVNSTFKPLASIRPHPIFVPNSFAPFEVKLSSGAIPSKETEILK